MAGSQARNTSDSVAWHRTHTASQTGVVVQEVTQYLGNRIVVDEQRVQDSLRFALLAEVFMRGHHGLRRPADDDSETSAQMESLSVVMGTMEGVVSSARRFERHPHESWKAEVQVSVVVPAAHINHVLTAWMEENAAMRDGWLRERAARQRWPRFVSRLAAVVWQGNCTTLLSQRIRTEVDVDDGLWSGPSTACTSWRALAVPSARWWGTIHAMIAHVL